MLKKIFKEVGRFILVAFLLCVYIIFCSWFESFSFMQKFLFKINFNTYLLLISVIPISTALQLWKKSKMWLIDLIIVILTLFALHFIAEEKESQITPQCKVDKDCPQPWCMNECGSVCESGRCIDVYCKTHGRIDEHFECICNEGWTGRFCEKEIRK